jgi:hypothetical protein
MTLTQAQRTEAGRLMDVLVNHRGRVHYAQVRPMHTIVGPRAIRPGRLLLALGRTGGITMDCSEAVTLIAHLAGWRDPNGRHFNGTGNTDSLYAYLDEHYEDAHRAREGALWVVGPVGATEHVAMVRHPGPNPTLFSHGTEADPRYFTLDELRAGFPGQPWRFCSVAKL